MSGKDTAKSTNAPAPSPKTTVPNADQVKPGVFVSRSSSSIFTTVSTSKK